MFDVQLLDSIDDVDVWLNVAPLLADYQHPTPPAAEPTDGRAQSLSAIVSVVVLAAASVILVL